MYRLTLYKVGQYSYHSRVTDTTEYLPVSLSIVGSSGQYWHRRFLSCRVGLSCFRTGTDHDLLRFLEEFFNASNLPSFVKTGALCFER